MTFLKAYKTLMGVAFALTAFLALSALHPLVASAQTVTLSPASATNPVNATHTVTAQVTGVCAEAPGSPDVLPDDNEGAPCVTAADCGDGVDDICDFSAVAGKAIGIGVVGGTNSGAFTTWTTVDANGQATFQYTSTVVGSDTIQACLDLDSGGVNDEGTGTDAGDLAMCISDAAGAESGTDIASNQVTKEWLTVVGTIVLSPLSAVNPDNPAPAKHTVSAQVTGIERCAGGGLGNNDGALCSNDADCTGGDTCSDPSGVTVGFQIVSGPNAGDKGWTTTDASGIATLTYTSNGVPGTDTIQGCIDGDPASPGVPDENTPLVSECITDAAGGTEPDFASNQVTKRWDPTLSLQNLDAGATLANLGVPVYTPNPAYNPVGSTHTVRATVVGAQTICTGGANNRNACSTIADCTGGDTCGLAGYPVWFGVLAGSQNAGDLPGPVLTDSNGNATITYTDTKGAGVDTIQACVDADPAGANDDASFTECVTDYPGEADVPSNTVLKTWLSTYVTGGGKVITGTKTWDSFGGVVGYKPGSKTALIGEWSQQVHPSKGGNVNCHWNAFTSFALSCSTSSCGANPDTVVFTTANVAGACKGLAGAQGESVKIVATGTKPAKISVFAATNGILNVATPTALVPGSGNFVIHP